MRLLLPLISLIIFLFVLAPRALANSNLEVSDRSDFATAVRNFSSGQTIFVRINPGAVGASVNSSLNLRDNGYNLVNSFSLTRDGSYFSAIIPAPYGAGYFSLEATIDGGGSNIVSVKTIKVGSPNEANIKVNVGSRVQGQSVSSSSQHQSKKDQSDQSLQSSSPDLSLSPSQEPQVYVQVEKTFWQSAGDFFKKIWRLVFGGS